MRRIETEREERVKRLVLTALKAVAPGFENEESLLDVCDRKFGRLKISEKDRTQQCSDLLIAYSKILEAEVDTEFHLDSKKRESIIEVSRQVISDGIEHNTELSNQHKADLQHRAAKFQLQTITDAMAEASKKGENAARVMLHCGETLTTDNAFANPQTGKIVICPGSWISFESQSHDFGEMRKVAFGTTTHEGGHLADGSIAPYIWKKFNECVDSNFHKEFPAPKTSRYVLGYFYGEDVPNDFEDAKETYKRVRLAEISADYISAESFSDRFSRYKIPRDYGRRLVASGLSSYCHQSVHEKDISAELFGPDPHLRGAERIDFIIKGNEKMRKYLGCDNVPYNTCNFNGAHRYTIIGPAPGSSTTKSHSLSKE